MHNLVRWSLAENVWFSFIVSYILFLWELRRMFSYLTCFLSSLQFICQSDPPKESKLALIVRQMKEKSREMYSLTLSVGRALAGCDAEGESQRPSVDLLSTVTDSDKYTVPFVNLWRELQSKLLFIMEQQQLLHSSICKWIARVDEPLAVPLIKLPWKKVIFISKVAGLAGCPGNFLPSKPKVKLSHPDSAWFGFTYPPLREAGRKEG